MSLTTGVLFLLIMPFGLWLLGARLARALPNLDPAERFAWGLLAGLGVLILMMAIVNAFTPLRGWAAWLCLAPILLAANGSSLRDDWRATSALRSVRSLALIAGTAVFLVLLLWPRLSQPDLLYHEGTAGHDAFLWVVNAEYLQHSSYLTEYSVSPTHPALNSAQAMSGWFPDWGRMAAEGYLSLLSSLTGASPLGVYTFASAALFFPWLAAVFLFVRTFVTTRLSTVALFALGSLQPLFAFAHNNANLPNLIGAICAAIPVLVVARSLRQGSNETSISECLLLMLGVHGVLCAYPELTPFIGLPLFLLFWRGWRRGYAVQPLATALVAGALLWPLTTWRAAHGFMVSFAFARTSDLWSNIIRNVEPAGVLPALVTLSPKTGTELGWLGGLLVSVILIVSGGWAIMRARDNLGVLFALAGGAALALYTAATGFSYGWQKTIQFSAVPISAILPIGAIALAGTAPRRLGIVIGSSLAIFFVYAQVIIELDLLKWSKRKNLSSDWLQLEAGLRTQPEGDVTIEAASFSYPFFYTMWASYFLREAGTVKFVARGDVTGGYLNPTLTTVPAGEQAGPVLVGRKWADTLDANSPRLVSGRDFALLGQANRLITTAGMEPAFGVPLRVKRAFSLTLVPHKDAEFLLEIDARGHSGTWEIDSDQPEARTSVSTEGSTWILQTQLCAGLPQTISFRYAPADSKSDSEDIEMSFSIHRVMVRSLKSDLLPENLMESEPPNDKRDTAE